LDKLVNNFINEKNLPDNGKKLRDALTAAESKAKKIKKNEPPAYTKIISDASAGLSGEDQQKIAEFIEIKEGIVEEEKLLENPNNVVVFNGPVNNQPGSQNIYSGEGHTNNQTSNSKCQNCSNLQSEIKKTCLSTMPKLPRSSRI